MVAIAVVAVYWRDFYISARLLYRGEIFVAIVAVAMVAVAVVAEAVVAVYWRDSRSCSRCSSVVWP